MRRIQATAAVILGLAIAVAPAASNAAAPVPATGDCGATASSTTVTVVYDGEPTLIISDNFGTCLASTGRTVTAEAPAVEQAKGAAPAVPVPARPAFTG
jgi:hypothetical protein